MLRIMCRFIAIYSVLGAHHVLPISAYNLPTVICTLDGGGEDRIICSAIVVAVW